MDGSTELAGVAVWCFAVALAGGAVGLVLGNIRLPVILLAAGSPAGAAGANIAISGVAAGAASIAHIRAGRVNWRLFAVMAPPSAVGAIVGGLISGSLPSGVLLGIIGTALLYFGIDLLRPKAPRPAPLDGGPDYRAAALSGAAIGLLGGIVGLILGSLRMPALLRYVGESPQRAVGTNITVGVVVGIAGLIGHLPGGVDWTLFLVGSAASIPGALLGSRLTGRISDAALLRTVGVVLLVAGATAIADALL